MANGATHGLAAFATITALSVADERRHGLATFRPLLDGTAGGLLTCLPDKLEPAIHPNHRQFFHSIAFAIGVGCATYLAYKWEPTDDWERILRWLFLIGGSAYLTHLALDACTAKSLPLIGKIG